MAVLSKPRCGRVKQQMCPSFDGGGGQLTGMDNAVMSVEIPRWLKGTARRVGDGGRDCVTL